MGKKLGMVANIPIQSLPMCKKSCEGSIIMKSAVTKPWILWWNFPDLKYFSKRHWVGHHITGGHPKDAIWDGSGIYDVAHHVMSTIWTWLVNESNQATSVLSQHLRNLEPGILDTRSMNHPGEQCLELDTISSLLGLSVLWFLHTLVEHSGVELLCCCWQPPMLL